MSLLHQRRFLVFFLIFSYQGNISCATKCMIYANNFIDIKIISKRFCSKKKNFLFIIVIGYPSSYMQALILLNPFCKPILFVWSEYQKGKRSIFFKNSNLMIAFLFRFLPTLIRFSFRYHFSLHLAWLNSWKILIIKLN